MKGQLSYLSWTPVLGPVELHSSYSSPSFPLCTDHRQRSGSHLGRGTFSKGSNELLKENDKEVWKRKTRTVGIKLKIKGVMASSASQMEK